MEETYKIIDDLIQDLLVPARTEKRIDNNTLEKFCSILTELEIEMKGKEMIPRKIAGILYFIYVSLSSEITQYNYNDELFMDVKRLDNIIDKILWDSPFSN